jgi:hypothetical protein
MIDITMTAALRPEIIEQTLVSICKYVKCSEPLRLIINVDGRGDMSSSEEEIMEIVNKYFQKENTICRIPKLSAVTEAQRWIWETSESEYVLNWEDDCVAEKELDIDSAIELHEKHSNIGMMLFDRCDKSMLNHNGYENSFTYFKDNLYIRHKGVCLWGSPMLIKRNYIKQALSYFIDNEYMEITARADKVQEFLRTWVICTYMGSDGSGNFVRDIGREWLEKMGLIRKKESAIGYIWERGNTDIPDRSMILIDAIKNNGFKIGVEIGVRYGTNYNCILQECPDLKYSAVDQWKEVEGFSEQNQKTGFADFKNRPVESYKSYVEEIVKKYPDRAEIIHTDSITGSTYFRDNSLDFVFIDADHRSEFVRADIAVWMPKLKMNGIMFGHDINYISVRKVADSIFGDKWKYEGEFIWSAKKGELRCLEY